MHGAQGTDAGGRGSETVPPEPRPRSTLALHLPGGCSARERRYHLLRITHLQAAPFSVFLGPFPPNPVPVDPGLLAPLSRRPDIYVEGTCAPRLRRLDSAHRLCPRSGPGAAVSAPLSLSRPRPARSPRTLRAPRLSASARLPAAPSATALPVSLSAPG